MGIFADVLGARYIIAVAMIGSGLLGMLYAPVSHLGVGYLCALRALQGLIQSGQFPSQTSLWGKWSPSNERTTLLASNAAATIGILISNSLTPLICASIGWESVFYIYGACAVVWPRMGIRLYLTLHQRFILMIPINRVCVGFTTHAIHQRTARGCHQWSWSIFRVI